MRKQIDEARAAGYTDQEIVDFLSKGNSDKAAQFKEAAQNGYAPEEILNFVVDKSLRDRPLSEKIKSAASQYGAGAAGGVGGFPKDIFNLLAESGLLGFFGKAVAPHVPGATTPELTSQFREKLGAEEPQTSLERILAQAGEFGGQEGLIGTTLGGPVGGLLGLAHGSAAGTIYGGLKELGANDTVALLGTFLTTLAPKAAFSLIDKIKAGKATAKDVSQASKIFKQKTGVDINDLAGGEPPTPPGASATETLKPAIAPGENIPGARGTEAIREQVLQELAPTVEGGQKLSLEMPQLEQKPGKARKITVEDTPLGDSVYKKQIGTSFDEGKELFDSIKNELVEEKEKIRKLYADAREVSSSHADVFPKTAEAASEIISQLERLPEKGRNPAQTATLKYARGVQELVGNSSGYLEQPVSTLIAQADSLAQAIPMELAFPGVKGMLKSLIKTINDESVSVLKKNGLNYRAIVEADKTYAKMADKFFVDELKPFLEKKTLDPESLFEAASKNRGTYRAVKEVLKSKKPSLINKLDKAVVENALGKYSKNPGKVGSREYNKDVADLSKLIGEKKVGKAHAFLKNKKSQFERNKLLAEKVKERAPKVATQYQVDRLKEKFNKKYQTTDQIQKSLSSRSKIKELKKDLSEKGMSKTFDALAEKEVQRLFREGKYGAKKLTGKDIVNTIDRHYEVLEELMGEEVVSNLYKIGEAAKNNELTQELAKKIIKTTAKVGLTVAGLGKLNKFLNLLVK